MNNINQKKENLLKILNFLNNQNENINYSLFLNLKSFSYTLLNNCSNLYKLNYRNKLGYINSNICKLIKKNGEEVINIRNINYFFNSYGYARFLDNFEKINRTINTNNDQIIFEDYNGFKTFKNVDAIGIEDIRLFENTLENKIQFIATTKIFNEKNKNQICIGDYLINYENRLKVTKVFKSPNDVNEKNWLILDENKIIYSYYPFNIYNFNLEKEIEIYNLPNIFKYFRGSTNPIYINNNFKMLLVHFAFNDQYHRRYYLHSLLILDKNNIPKIFSLPFTFENQNIEYCLSMNLLKNGNLEFAYSIWDSSPKLMEIPLEFFNDKLILI